MLMKIVSVVMMIKEDKHVYAFLDTLLKKMVHVYKTDVLLIHSVKLVILPEV